MKKLATLVLMSMMVLALAATASASSQIPNPLVEVADAQAIESQLGLEMPLPKGATPTSFCIIGDTLGEINFDWESGSYCYRAQRSDELVDISGLYGSFAHVESVEFDGIPVTLSLNDGTDGMVSWFHDGVSYSLAMAENANEDALFNVLIDILYV